MGQDNSLPPGNLAFFLFSCGYVHALGWLILLLTTRMYISSLRQIVY